MKFEKQTRSRLIKRIPDVPETMAGLCRQSPVVKVFFFGAFYRGLVSQRFREQVYKCLTATLINGAPGFVRKRGCYDPDK